MQNVLGTWPADTVEKAQEKRARDSLEQTLQTALMLAVGAFQGVLGVAGVFSESSKRKGGQAEAAQAEEGSDCRSEATCSPHRRVGELSPATVQGSPWRGSSAATCPPGIAAETGAPANLVRQRPQSPTEARLGRDSVYQNGRAVQYVGPSAAWRGVRIDWI
ncbi:unnamed protein product [Durusdinium trenchii]|uniref:Uncharacterized protein n=1 Tax=Durusdinium trenchii TaxID=1381693 RepID=A0ABP0NL69_9DINO